MHPLGFHLAHFTVGGFVAQLTGRTTLWPDPLGAAPGSGVGRCPARTEDPSPDWCFLRLVSAWSHGIVSCPSIRTASALETFRRVLPLVLASPGDGPGDGPGAAGPGGHGAAQVTTLSRPRCCPGIEMPSPPASAAPKTSNAQPVIHTSDRRMVVIQILIWPKDAPNTTSRTSSASCNTLDDGCKTTSLPRREADGLIISQKPIQFKVFVESHPMRENSPGKLFSSQQHGLYKHGSPCRASLVPGPLDNTTCFNAGVGSVVFLSAATAARLLLSSI